MKNLKSSQLKREGLSYEEFTAEAARDMRILRIKMGKRVYQFLNFQNALFRLGTINPAQSYVMEPD